MTRVTVFGAPFDLIPADAALQWLADRRQNDPYAYVVNPNVDHVLRLSKRDDLTVLYTHADQSWCDSKPLRRLAKSFGYDLPHLAGSDATGYIFNHVLTTGDSIAVIGAQQALIEVLRTQYPALTIHAHIPPMGFAEDPIAFEACITFCKAHPARFLFLAVGSPQSELLAYRLKQDPRMTGTALCIGASLEFLVGWKRRAPQWMRALGIEWLYRLISEPKRLWKRYIGGAFPLLVLYLRERGKHR